MESILKNKKLLVIAPHPDDESLGCSGLIAKVKDLGGYVYVLVLSCGDLSHYTQDLKKTPSSVRKKELKNACEILCVDKYEIVYDDTKKYMKLDIIPQKELIEIIEKKAKLSIQNVKPDILAIPALSYNQDHRAVFQASFSALRPHIREKKFMPNLVLVYEANYLFWNYFEFKPNFYVDITKYLDIKLKAISCHASQMCNEASYILSVENIERLARIRGSQIGVCAAEAFECLKFIA